MKKYLLAPLALLAATQVAQADTTSRQITVTAIVPTSAFVVRDEGNWMATPQSLPSFDDGSLGSVQNRMYLKSTTGAVTAKFMSNPTITSGRTNIPLSFSIAGVDLTTTAQEVVPQNDAAAGQSVETVLGVAAAGPYTPGNYRGIVNVVFETPAP